MTIFILSVVGAVAQLVLSHLDIMTLPMKGAIFLKNEKSASFDVKLM